MKICITVAQIGKSILMKNIIDKTLCGLPPYNVTFKNDETIVKEFVNVNDLEQSFTYPLKDEDKGFHDFSVTVTDKILNHITEFCRVEITKSNSHCKQLIVMPQSVFSITNYGFKALTEKICGSMSNDISKNFLTIWAAIKVENAPVNLKITCKINFVDNNNNMQEIILQKTGFFQVGEYEDIIVGETTYQPGTYNIVDVIPSIV